MLRDTNHGSTDLKGSTNVQNFNSNQSILDSHWLFPLLCLASGHQPIRCPISTGPNPQHRTDRQ